MDINLIIDTSVAVKWLELEGEEYTGEAKILLKNIVNGKIRVATLDLLMVEYTNALHKGKKFTEKQISDSLIRLTSLPIKFIPISLALLEDAVKLAIRFDQTIYDALYLSLAKSFHCKVVTSDRELSKVASFSTHLNRYK
ncbi:MAG: PilT protein domain protein [Candidatus Gottesmanbacteria bacterium GW2011_GWA2_41_12]|uniref:PilT protein domain protein n=1 Tax=Candidatus Gottesmanbacteria bacterium GW2011_GWA2_41_12 TaxID=1618440 RepID=A0A0G0ULP8_9BACT|nr:MAG: PilT protein domain protein [Candidatus Gottesmanbacteria bacterium GW2011_GWA2_41_12]